MLHPLTPRASCSPQQQTQEVQALPHRAAPPSTRYPARPPPPPPPPAAAAGAGPAAAPGAQLGHQGPRLLGLRGVFPPSPSALPFRAPPPRLPFPSRVTSGSLLVMPRNHQGMIGGHASAPVTRGCAPPPLPPPLPKAAGAAGAASAVTTRATAAAAAEAAAGSAGQEAGRAATRSTTPTPRPYKTKITDGLSERMLKGEAGLGAGP